MRTLRRSLRPLIICCLPDRARWSLKTARDLWVLPLVGDKKPMVVAQTEFEEYNARFPPDGRSIAYASDEPGQFEVYVQPFPGPGGKSLISTSGGTAPQWRRDGRELYYVTRGNLMAVPIGMNGPTVEAGTPVVLFPMPTADYAALPDGQSFLINMASDTSTPPITVVLNWKPPVRR